MINILYSHLKKKFGFVKVEKDEDEIREVPRSNSTREVNNAKDIVVEDNQSQNSGTSEFHGKIKTAERVDGGDTNDFFTIIIQDEEHYASLKNIPWNLCEGDRVVVIIERNADVQTIVDIKPKRRKEIVFGRVTAISYKKGYAIFENKTLLLFECLKKMEFSLKVHDEYKYEVIESDQKYDDKIFDYRVLKLLEKVESIVSDHGISIKSEPFKISLNYDKDNQDNTVSKYIKYILVRNRSDKSVNIMTVKTIPLTDEGDLVKLDMAGREINFNLTARKGTFKVFFRIRPSKPGLFRYKLIAQFNEFEETHEFSVEITESFVISAPKMRVTRFVDIKLNEYPVPHELKEIDYSKASLASEELTNLYPVLTESVEATNYVEKMQLGIFLEEIALEKAFESYRIKEACFETKGDFLRLTVKDIAEKRPSIIVGDKVTATDPFRTSIFEGCIHKVENESILCKFHPDFHSSHRDKTFSIDFNFSRTTYRRQQFALEQVTSDADGLGFNFLFPNKIETKKPQIDASVDVKGILQVDKFPRKWYNNLLNEHQKYAVVMALRGENRPLPYIFFGCPGSGKTQTIIETILQIHTLLKTSRILIATPSNSAANLVTQQLINSDVFDRTNPKFLRLVSNNQVEKELIPDNLIKYCATISIEADNRNQKRTFERNDQGILKDVTKNKILEYRIVIATLNCFGSFLQMKFHSKFSHVFIDESGQSVEPETLIPLTLLNKNDGQCVLAGDPNQLGPILTSRFAKFYKYDYSLMERLLFGNQYYKRIYGADSNEYDPKFVTKLNINYRALPSLLKLYNDLFYNGELVSAVDEKYSIEASLMSNADFLWKNVNRKCSVIFVNVNNGRNRKIQESCSWYNEEEIRAIMSFLHKCSSSQVPFKEIGVVTPYALQVKKIKHQVSVGTSETDLKIGTVEEFQGQERSIILVSTVRTESNIHSDRKFGLGFLQCPKRMNVAISRARALLVVFGKEAILHKDENWNYLINYAKKNRTYVSENY